MDQGPPGVIPKSHLLDGPMLSQYDETGKWIGCLSDRDTARLDPSRITIRAPA